MPPTFLSVVCLADVYILVKRFSQRPERWLCAVTQAAIVYYQYFSPMLIDLETQWREFQSAAVAQEAQTESWYQSGTTLRMLTDRSAESEAEASSDSNGGWESTMRTGWSSRDS